MSQESVLGDSQGMRNVEMNQGDCDQQETEDMEDGGSRTITVPGIGTFGRLGGFWYRWNEETNTFLGIPAEEQQIAEMNIAHYVNTGQWIYSPEIQNVQSLPTTQQQGPPRPDQLRDNPRGEMRIEASDLPRQGPGTGNSLGWQSATQEYRKPNGSAREVMVGPRQLGSQAQGSIPRSIPILANPQVYNNPQGSFGPSGSPKLDASPGRANSSLQRSPSAIRPTPGRVGSPNYQNRAWQAPNPKVMSATNEGEVIEDPIHPYLRDVDPAWGINMSDEELIRSFQELQQHCLPCIGKVVKAVEVDPYRGKVRLEQLQRAAVILHTMDLMPTIAKVEEWAVGRLHQELDARVLQVRLLSRKHFLIILASEDDRRKKNRSDGQPGENAEEQDPTNTSDEDNSEFDSEDDLSEEEADAGLEMEIEKGNTDLPEQQNLKDPATGEQVEVQPGELETIHEDGIDQEQMEESRQQGGGNNINLSIQNAIFSPEARPAHKRRDLGEGNDGSRRMSFHPADLQQRIVEKGRSTQLTTKQDQNRDHIGRKSSRAIYCIIDYTFNDKGGAALIIRPDIKVVRAGVRGTGTVAWRILEINQQRIGVASVYSPSGDVRRRRELYDWLKDLGDGNSWALAGDWNMVLNAEDSIGPTPLAKGEELRHWRSMDGAWDLVDAFHIASKTKGPFFTRQAI
ncbi:hypothetical protein R1sor_025174 [Riccia sorocarpa]|uniref:Uncharacterized protein n=1 Tax=Riccia sorocarpa TaxID=122646 RepID=A0ABD3G9E6_9MARC